MLTAGIHDSPPGARRQQFLSVDRVDSDRGLEASVPLLAVQRGGALGRDRGGVHGPRGRPAHGEPAGRGREGVHGQYPPLHPAHKPQQPDPLQPTHVAARGGDGHQGGSAVRLEPAVHARRRTRPARPLPRRRHGGVALHRLLGLQRRAYRLLPVAAVAVVLCRRAAAHRGQEGSDRSQDCCHSSVVCACAADGGGQRAQLAADRGPRAVHAVVARVRDVVFGCFVWAAGRGDNGHLAVGRPPDGSAEEWAGAVAVLDAPLVGCDSVRNHR
mmetsp:Transcript_14527/g.28738  ORF Transcript_14527/g.28738 Transcript_14527/m.28738 type:complete len:271 (+) Transcript_14527:79-891(+)